MISIPDIYRKARQGGWAAERMADECTRLGGIALQRSNETDDRDERITMIMRSRRYLSEALYLLEKEKV